MSDDGITPPSRERFREERRPIRAADRRRKLIGVPVVIIGLGLVATGAYIYTQDDSTNVPVNVQGTTVERTTTTTSTTTTTTSTTTLPPTTLPPTTVAPTTTVKKKVVRPATTVAPTTAPDTAPPHAA